MKPSRSSRKNEYDTDGELITPKVALPDEVCCWCGIHKPDMFIESGIPPQWNWFCPSCYHGNGPKLPVFTED